MNAALARSVHRLATAAGIAGLALLGVAALGPASPASAHEGAQATLTRLDAWIAGQPDDPQLHIARAEERRRAGDYDGAREDLAVVARVAPNHPLLPLERGLVEAAVGDPEAALRDLDRHIADAPEPHRDAFAARARILEDAARYADAVADWDRAIALAPDPDAYLARGRAAGRMDRWDLAAEGYRRGIARLGGAIVLRMALVDAERRHGALDAALAAADALLEVRPDHPEWLLMRADVIADRGDASAADAERRRALALLDAAIEARGGGLLRRVARARALAALGRVDEARAELAEVLVQGPALGPALALRAELDR